MALKDFIERSSSAWSAASTGERLAACESASADCAVLHSSASAQKKGITRLRIDVVKGCLTRN